MDHETNHTEDFFRDLREIVNNYHGGKHPKLDLDLDYASSSDERKLNDVLKEIKKERDRQDIAWGVRDLPIDTWIAVLAKQFGQASACALDKDMDGFRHQLIQVAAVAVAAIEQHDAAMNIEPRDLVGVSPCPGPDACNHRKILVINASNLSVTNDCIVGDTMDEFADGGYTHIQSGQTVYEAELTDGGLKFGACVGRMAEKDGTIYAMDVEYSQGICGDGIAILKDGVQMTPEEIIQALRVTTDE